MCVSTKEKFMPRDNDFQSLQDLRAQAFQDLEARIMPCSFLEQREEDNEGNDGGDE